MKNFFTLALAGILFISCSSDDDSGTTLPTTSQAQAQYDDSNYGLYKGVFVGSSGFVLVNINNDDGAVGAKVVIDGTTYNFTTTETVTEDSPIGGLTFTSGSMSFDFFVNSDGNSPYVTNIDFPGHANAGIEILKEYSDMMVEVFQGTFNGDDAGAFNLIVQDGEISGLARSNDDGEPIYLYGMFMGNNTIMGEFDGGTFDGSRNGNNLNGTWENTLGESGNYSGTRKL